MDSAGAAPPSGRKILVGPAGWSYQDWKGRVYPSRPPRGFDSLLWIARFFDFVEVNASFYRIPSARTAESWVERLADHPDFVLGAKLHRDFTHGERLIEPAAARAMRAFVEPLRAADRLGPLLAQFPWSFRPSDDAIDHLCRLRDRFDDLAIVFELRHGDFGRAEWAGRLAAESIDLVSLDQPAVGNALGPGPRAGDVGYVRLHGRNQATWFAKDVGRDARYDYLYSATELEEWIVTVQSMAESLGRVHVVTNNHFRGQAVINAFELKRLLGLPVEEVPIDLLEEFPQVRAGWRQRGWAPREVAPTEPNATDTDDPSRQGELFG